MKKNTVKIALLTILAAGGLTACGEGWLDVSSKTESNSDNFYKTEEDGLRALYACYDGWQRTVSDGPQFSVYQLTETMSDECFGGTGNNDARNTPPSRPFRHQSVSFLYHDAQYPVDILLCSHLPLQ